MCINQKTALTSHKFQVLMQDYSNRTGITHQSRRASAAFWHFSLLLLKRAGVFEGRELSLTVCSEKPIPAHSTMSVTVSVPAHTSSTSLKNTHEISSKSDSSSGK